MMINRELLEKQFTGKEVKQRVGNFGKKIDYVDTQLVIQRLNDAFDQLWSFKVIEHTILENEVIVLGELYTAGISKQQFGSSSITKNAKTGAVVSIGDDLKAASSDSLKKCASLLGVALHIYGDSLPDQPVTTERINTANGPVDLPKDEEPPRNTTDSNGQTRTPKGKLVGPPIEFTTTNEPPKDQPDKPRLQKMTEAYFASLPEFLKDEISRHAWQKKNIGIESTKDWTEFHFEKALDLINILNKEHDPEDKKPVPELDESQYQNNFGNDPATTAQLKYMDKLLEKKGYYVKGNGNNVWTKGKASVLINWLNDQQ